MLSFLSALIAGCFEAPKQRPVKRAVKPKALAGCVWANSFVPYSRG